MPFLSGSKSLLAISGGADSVALGLLFHQAGYPFEVAHVNYGLRGEESHGDEQFVKSLCDKWGVKFHIIRPRTLQFAEKNKLSVQMAARQLRYDFFEQIRQTSKCSSVCTAHHRTDNLEHFFIYLLRNSPAAWWGIPEKNNHICRPMMFASSDEIRQWLIAVNQNWRNDSSNESLHYLRNRVRHLILPQLQQLFPEAESEFFEISRQQRTLAEQAKNNLSIWAAKTAQKINGALFFPTGTHTGKLAQYLVLRGMNRATANRFLQQHEPGKQFHFNGQCIEVVHGGYRIKKSRNMQFDTRLADQAPMALHFAHGQIQLSVIPKSEVDFKKTDVFFMDADNLQWPICFRSFSNGDRFVPFGMNGSRKVSDILTDLHIPASDKPAYPVVETENGVLGVLPFRRSSLLPVNEKTQRVLCIEWKSLPHE